MRMPNSHKISGTVCLAGACYLLWTGGAFAANFASLWIIGGMILLGIGEIVDLLRERK